MSLTNRLLSNAIRDMQHAMTAFEQPFFNNVGPLLGSRAVGPTSQLLRSYPAADLIEKPDAYELQAELPGYDKNNIKIELADSRTLVLSGTVNEQKEVRSPSSTSGDQQAATVEEGGQQQDSSAATTDENRVVSQKENEGQVTTAANNHHQYWINERVSSSFSRAFQFPAPINAEDIKAQFDNGILKVTIPKSTQDQPKQINIE